MTKMELLNLLMANAKQYVPLVESSLKNNLHMHKYRNKKSLTAKEHQLIDAVIVDFINFVAMHQGIDLAMYTKDLE